MLNVVKSRFLSGKKPIFSVALYIVILYLVVSLISCNKENPIVPPPPEQPDTASRFLWSRTDKIIYSPVSNLYVADSVNIYIEADGSCVYYDGINYKFLDFHDLYYYNNKVYGFDKNNIFFAGSRTVYKGYPKDYPVLKKLNNGVLKSYDLDTSETSISDILVTGPNEVWVAARSVSKIYYFNNDIIKSYRLNNSDSVNLGKIYKDKLGNLYVFVFKRYSFGIDGTMYTYKFNGSEFELLRTDCYSYITIGCLTNYMYRCGDDIIMWNINGGIIYYFNGNKWTFLCNTLPYVVPFRFGGWSKDSLIFMYNQWPRIYLFNGKKWRKENYYFDLAANGGTNDAQLETKNSNVYIAYYNYDAIQQSFLIIGKPNKKNQNNFK
jgi:hypothetical protein